MQSCRCRPRNQSYLVGATQATLLSVDLDDVTLDGRTIVSVVTHSNLVVVNDTVIVGRVPDLDTDVSPDPGSPLSQAVSIKPYLSSPAMVPKPLYLAQPDPVITSHS
jgi:hypothetical protein